MTADALEAKAVTERDDDTGRRVVGGAATGRGKRRMVQGRTAPARRRADGETPPPAGQPRGKGRVVRTEAGARRYGVAVGQVYYGEGTGDLERGAAGERTRSAQDQLARAGFLDEASGRNKGRDGLFGPKTEAAVRQFQASAGLPVTGKLDKGTLSKLADHAPGGDPAGGKGKAPAKKAPAKAGGGRAAAARPAGGESGGPARAPGEPKPDGTDATSKAIIKARFEHFGLQPVKPRPGGKKPQEDEVPMTAPGGAKLVDYSGEGLAIYSDGSVFDGQGWQPGKPAKRKAATGQKKALLSELEVLAVERLRL